MRALYFEQSGTNILVMGQLPEPEPAKDQVVVRVYAAGVIPSETQWFPTFHDKSGTPRRFPIVLGHEFSGIVRATGPDVSNVRLGEPVYGLNNWFTNGAQADYCLCPASSLAPKPRTLDHVHAAVVPISALTAWQAIHERTQLAADERILIHGGAGSVGSFAVQLARLHGAEVIATASQQNLDFVRSLGASHVISYQKEKFEDYARDIDVVLDTVGGNTLLRSLPLLSRRGRVVSVVSSTRDDLRTRDTFLLVRADRSQLAEMGALIDAGHLQVPLGPTFPLEHGNEAYARARNGHVRGKIALLVRH